MQNAKCAKCRVPNVRSSRRSAFSRQQEGGSQAHDQGPRTKDVRRPFPFAILRSAFCTLHSAFCTLQFLARLVRKKAGAHRHGAPSVGLLVRQDDLAHRAGRKAVGRQLSAFSRRAGRSAGVRTGERRAGRESLVFCSLSALLFQVRRRSAQFGEGDMRGKRKATSK